MLAEYRAICDLFCFSVYESQAHLFGEFSEGISKAKHSHRSVSYEFGLTECLFFRERGR